MANWDFDDNLFEIESPLDIDLDEFMNVMDRRTYACIRGLVSAESMYDAYDRIVQRFDRKLDHASKGHSADAVRSNFQKLLVGGESKSASNDDARFFRSCYSPFWAEDIWGLHDGLRQLARMRNRLAMLPPEFALEGIEANGLWTAARFHQYPKGGGFFRRHTDYIVKDVADEKSTRFYQVVLTITRKGEHFKEGGAFVDIGDQRIVLDDRALPGDIIVYDGRTMHGVEDIDSTERMDLDTINGRIAGFATLYKKM
jgi:hypothetical protein